VAAEGVRRVGVRFTWNHLWYLAYLLFYTLVLAALLPLLRSRPGVAMQRAFLALRGWRLLVYPAAPLLFYTLALQPRFGETHDLIHDWYLHAMYFTMFLWGVWLGMDEAIWKELSRLRKVTLVLALVVFVAYMALVYLLRNNPPFSGLLLARALRNAYIWLALCTILGWGHALLDRPFRWLPFATEAVYPWYILHQSLIVLLAYWLIPLKVGPVMEPALVLAGTIAGCWALHVGVIARVGWLRACFGLRRVMPASTREPTAGSAIAR
jgi:peptidoglycan/LPS O-acetylase OafA/YrhL